MKTMKSFLGICAFSALMASCLSDQENYQAGFYVDHPTSNSGVNAYYANNVSDSLLFYGYGNWAIEDYVLDVNGYDNSWVTVPQKKGYGMMYIQQKLSFLQNTTGKSRWAAVRIVDVNHSDAYAPLVFFQYATRGDGSLGNAADVKSIVGSDGSQIELAYDELHRPTNVSITKEGSLLSKLTIAYSDRDSIMTVTDRTSEFKVKYGNDFQPYLLANANDTVGYYRYYGQLSDGTSYPVSENKVFNFRHLGMATNSCVTHCFPENGVSLHSDSLRNIERKFFFKDGKRVGDLSLTYSMKDNRSQSVDANQLLQGVEECDPYLLVSLFRYTRSTSIVKQATGKQGDADVSYSVETDLNADKSIREMRVTSGSQTITYTFNY